MEKSNSNRLITTFNRVLIGTTVLGAIGAGTYFAYMAISQKEDDVVFYKSNIQEKPFEYSDLKVTEGWGKMPYLGEAGLKLLNKQIHDELGFGPEVMGLNSINLTDGDMISNENNGFYQEATNEIYLNSKTLSGLVPYSASLEDKVQAVYQTLFHEYGHFLASSYLKNVQPGTDAIADIYQDKHKSTWNKFFVDKFKHQLKYDIVTPKYKFPHPIKYEVANAVNTYPRIPNPAYLDTNIDIINNLYTVKELFEISNGQNGIYNIPVNKAAFVGLVPGFNVTPLGEENLKYLFSMDELYTRKYQQIRMVLRNHGKWHDGWVWENNTSSRASTFAIDTTRYQRGVNPKTDPLHTSELYYHSPDNPYGHDSHFNETAGSSADMWSTMLEMMGQDNGADISYITTENTSHLVDDGKYLPEGNPDLIKFGGYISKASNYQYVGYKEGGKFHGVKIHRSDFKYGYKAKLLDSNLILPSGENVFYTLPEYVKGSDFIDKPLYFSDDAAGTHLTAMTTTRKKEAGVVSTWSPTMPKILQKNIYSVSEHSGSVYIRSKPWH